MSQPIDDGRISRREALKWMAASVATIAFLDTKSFGASAKGYGFDPNLITPEVTWPRTLSARQLETVTSLCDLIIPADERSPSASAVHVPDFIDEWISAPYPTQESDRKGILSGLEWLENEAKARFDKAFPALDEAQQASIADDICYLPKAAPKFREPAEFFAKFRNLTAGGYYTTQAGRDDVRYVGNVALASFDGPPPEVLRHLGLG